MNRIFRRKEQRQQHANQSRHTLRLLVELLSDDFPGRRIDFTTV